MDPSGRNSLITIAPWAANGARPPSKRPGGWRDGGPARRRRGGTVSIEPTTAVGLLYRRLGFGATPSELSSAASAGYSATVKALLGQLGQPDPGGDAVAVPTFAPIPSDLAALRSDPSARQSYLESLRSASRELIAWWVARMVATTTPAQEKLTFLLHGHFPTAISKVRY